MRDIDRASILSNPNNVDISDPLIQRNLVPYTRTLELTLYNYANNYTTSCVLDHPALDNTTTTAQHVPRHTGDVQRLAAGVTLHD